MDETMNKSIKILSCIIIALITGSYIMGCAAGNRGELNIVEKPTEDELRQDWNEYTVFSLRIQNVNLSLFFKIHDDRRIILDSRWIEVLSEDTMANSIVSQSAWVMEIFGNNDEIFGYMVLRTGDRASVKIIDKNTVQLYYHRIGYLN